MLIQDFRIECMLPDTVGEIVHSSLSTSRNGAAGHYQSGDAHVKEVNRNAKKWVIGVPTHKQWIQSFRNLDKLDAIRLSTFHDAGLHDEKDKSSLKS